ncbi:MAG: DUF2029 domain-containing protein [Myxococcales bacterium]|nr:DUF2029 domain-containing protein [Myxococcales bacterium]
MILLSYALLAAALQLSQGTLDGLPLGLASAAMLVAAIRTPGGAATPRQCALLLGLLGITALTRTQGIQLSGALSGGAGRTLFALLGLAVAGLAAAACLLPRLARGATVGLMIALHLVAGGLLIRASPDPHIDVFVFQQQGAQELLALRNPYAATFRNPYDEQETRNFYGDTRALLTCYAYPPISTVTTTASFAAAGDVRWVLLLAQAATALLLFLLARRCEQPPWLAVALAGMLLAHPCALLVLAKSWTDPLVAALATLALCGVATRRPWAGVALGLWVAAKQYSVVLLPLLLARRFVSRRQIAVAAAVALAVTAPLALWDLGAFFDDVVLCQVRQPLRMDAMSLPPVVAMLTGFRAPSALAFLAVAAALAWAWRRLPDGAPGLALGATLALDAFFLFNKQAFCNYYYLVGVLLLAAQAAAQPRQPR